MATHILFRQPWKPWILWLALAAILPFSCTPQESSKVAKTLTGRLLCASNATHGIKMDGHFEKLEPYYSGAGFLSEPVALAAGPENINACLVGKTQDGLVIAFRGTVAPKESSIAALRDWINNIFYSPTDSVEGFSGKVHKGFWRSGESLWEGIKQAVESQLATGDKVYLTGQSKGGALAMLIGVRLKESMGVPVEEVIVFGAPRSADADFVAAYQEAIPVTRYENHLDLVPFLPPKPFFIKEAQTIPVMGDLFAEAEDWGYSEMGRLRFITDKGDIDDKSLFLQGLRTTDLVVQLLKGKKGVEALLNAHKLDCHGRYFRKLCPEIDCGPE